MQGNSLVRFVPLALVLLCWALPPVMMRWLDGAGVDTLTMNTYRMFAGSLFLVPFGIWLNPRGMKQAVKNLHQFILPAALFTAAMLTWVYGLLRLGATVAALIGRSDALFTVLIGSMFFADERAVARDWRFLAALAVALAGVAGVALFRDESIAGGSLVLKGGFIGGVMLSLGSSFSWVCYVFSVKLMVRRIGSLVSFIMVALIAAFMMLAITAVVQAGGGANLAMPLRLDFKTNLVLLGSGFIGVGVGGILFYRSIDLIGVTVSQVSMLALPILTGVAAGVFLGEKITVMQIMSGMLLLAGVGAIVIVRAAKGSTQLANHEKTMTIRA
ncbi:MAG TPA: DMT family transporter [Planctomycetes bacterium]|nr:DMT family transporter [Planctomycetota bacterium]